MTAYEVSYQLGKYSSSLIVLAYDEQEAKTLAKEGDFIPKQAIITRIEKRS